jgi:hypothetical protein
LHADARRPDGIRDYVSLVQAQHLHLHTGSKQCAVASSMRSIDVNPFDSVVLAHYSDARSASGFRARRGYQQQRAPRTSYVIFAVSIRHGLVA